jgi:hypothetical protein
MVGPEWPGSVHPSRSAPRASSSPAARLACPGRIDLCRTTTPTVDHAGVFRCPRGEETPHGDASLGHRAELGREPRRPASRSITGSSVRVLCWWWVSPMVQARGGDGVQRLTQTGRRLREGDDVQELRTPKRVNWTHASDQGWAYRARTFGVAPGVTGLRSRRRSSRFRRRRAAGASSGRPAGRTARTA